MSVNSPPPPNNSFAWITPSGQPTVQFFDFMYKLWLNRVGGTNTDEELILSDGGVDSAAIAKLTADVDGLWRNSADDVRPVLAALNERLSVLESIVFANDATGELSAIKDELARLKQELSTLIG